MQPLIHSDDGGPAHGRKTGGLLRLAWRHLARTVGSFRSQRQLAGELSTLDHHACRDLGIDLSELGSYHAEAAGFAELTRRRVHGLP